MRIAALGSALVGGAALLTGLAAPAAVAPAAGFGPLHISSVAHIASPLTATLNSTLGRIGGFNQNGGNWSGYVAQGSGFSSASTGWTEPSVKCNSSNDLMAPWVGIDGDGSSSVEQTGVATDCSSGRAVYQGWYEMYPAAPVYYSNSVSAGDVFTASVTRSGTSYTLVLTDKTKGWTKTTKKSYNGANASAEMIIESPTAAYPNFGKVNFTGATINGKSLSSFSPVALDASNNSGYEDHTGAISGGGNFSITYEHE